MNTTSNDINGFSLLRVISVAMILIVHFGQSISLPDVLHQPIVWCRHGVQMFFLLSGYLIYASLKRNNNLVTFFKKRVIRIIPIYFAVLFVNIVLFDIILRVMPVDTLGLGWWRYFLFLQTMIPSVDVNYWNNISALWTMSAFALFYLISPLMWNVSRKGFVHCFFLIILIYILGLIASFFYRNLELLDIYSDSLDYIDNKNPISQLWIFAVGGGMFILRNTLRAKYIIPTIFAIFGLIYNKETVTLVCCFSVIVAATGPCYFFNIPQWLVFVLKKLDEYSFAIYLGHTTIIEFMSVVRDMYHLNTIMVALCSVVGTFLFILILHKYVERPITIYFTKHQNFIENR